jgi:hypothetical protein
MRGHVLVAALSGGIACASGQPGENAPPGPEAIAGTWEYRFPDVESLGGTIFISADTSDGSYNEVTFEDLGVVRTHRGVLRQLLDTGFFVCWTDETQQVAGLELTAHTGSLRASYFDQCRGNIRRSPTNAQRSVRHCRHTLLVLRRVAPP